MAQSGVEYVSLSACTKKAIILYRILFSILGAKEYKNFFFNTNKVCIFNDNQSAVTNANTQDIKERSKHIEVRYHFVKQAVNDGIISVKYVSTQEMLADILIKPLDKVKHQKIVKGLKLF